MARIRLTRRKYLRLTTLKTLNLTPNYAAYVRFCTGLNSVPFYHPYPFSSIKENSK